MAAEDAGWYELHGLVDSLTPDEAARPGYYEEGWSASDLLGHVGSWLAAGGGGPGGARGRGGAAGGAVLERIRAGTYQREEIDIDAWNERFLEAMRGVPLNDIRAQASAART